MSEATELLERMEHAGHSGGHGHGDHGQKKGPGRAIGVTMALLGVMLALCAALVGSERTELIRSTVEQSNKLSAYQAESTKYRVMLADIEMLHAITPSRAELAKFHDALSSVRAKSGRGDDEDTAEIKELIGVSTVELADVLTPDKEDEDRLQLLARRYQHDMAEAKEDAEAYDLAIEAHHEAAEGYERAQLCAEIGIVIASIALLLASRAVWIVSLVIGLAGGAVVGKTTYETHHRMSVAEQKLKDAVEHTAELTKEDDEALPSGGEKAEAPKPATSGAPSEPKEK